MTASYLRNDFYGALVGFNKDRNWVVNFSRLIPWVFSLFPKLFIILFELIRFKVDVLCSIQVFFFCTSIVQTSSLHGPHLLALRASISSISFAAVAVNTSGASLPISTESSTRMANPLNLSGQRSSSGT